MPLKSTQNMGMGCTLVWKRKLLQKHPKRTPIQKKILQTQKQIFYPQFKCPFSG